MSFLKNIQNLMSKYEKPMMTLASAAALTSLLFNINFDVLEANLYDFRTAKGANPSADPEIVMVTIDDGTVRALREVSPLPLDFHAQFMEALEKQGPKAIGYLVDLHQVHSANPDLFASGWAQRFVRAAERMRSKGTSVLLGTQFDVTGELVPPYPLSTLPHALAIVHKDGNVFSEDKVTRRALLRLDGKPAFHLSLAESIGRIRPDEDLPGSFRLPEVEGEYFFFRYHGTTRLRTKHLERSNYPIYSFLDVLRGNIPPETLKNKVVLVGTISRESASDFVLTPYSRVSFTNPKILVHANILDSVMNRHVIVRAAGFWNWFAAFSLIAAVIWSVMNSKPLNGVFATLGLMIGYMVLCHVLFQSKGLWLREAQPLIGIFAGFYLAVPYRLIREYQKRWDYQRKNELLLQVEEMKTNFMRLVTHDLKTPVARIQGLAEVLNRKAADRLIDRDKETLKHILDSTEELNNFISAILQLSQVESDRLQFKFESKDVNQLIERALESFKAPARARGIKIHAELEPLFPIRIDANLISKVINNLIDNALKYSPSDSQIFVESKEVDQWVVISVRDQGIGMSPEECSNLFTRFYRAKNERTASTKGTGLGLYLNKYFIERHHGRVEVESEPGKGSIFRIYLPLDNPAAAIETAAIDTEKGPRGVFPGLKRKISNALWVRKSRLQKGGIGSTNPNG